MRKTILLLTLLVVAACNSGDYAVHPPTKYQGNNSAIVVFVDIDKVDAGCRNIGGVGDYNIRGCEKGGVIVFPNPCQWPNKSDLRDLMCHELAHANGWPPDHPTN